MDNGAARLKGQTSRITQSVFPFSPLPSQVSSEETFGLQDDGIRHVVGRAGLCPEGEREASGDQHACLFM
jgi:hypothetical protein